MTKPRAKRHRIHDFIPNKQKIFLFSLQWPLDLLGSSYRRYSLQKREAKHKALCVADFKNACRQVFIPPYAFGVVVLETKPKTFAFLYLFT